MAAVTYRYLGSTGLRVSNMCLGAGIFGDHPAGRPSTSEEEAFRLMDRFAALGGNFIDTADVYNAGQSEEIVGKWLEKQKREQFVVATKCGRRMAPGPNGIGVSRVSILHSLEQSLKRLRTSYIDLYYVHVWDDGTPIEETLTTLSDLVTAGRVRYVGLCNTKGWQLQKAVDVCRARNLAPVICLQQQYSLLCRSPEWEAVEVCENEQVAFLPWSPLKAGWLSGKITREMVAPPEGSRVAWSTEDPASRAIHSHPDWGWFSSHGNPDQVWGLLDKLQNIAKAHERSVPQVALRWLLQKKYVTSVIIGCRTVQHLEDNMAAASGWQLSNSQMSELDAASAIPWPYPYDYLKEFNEERRRDQDLQAS